MARIDMKEAAGCLVVGAMVGAAIALLYAPQSGVRTKKDIKRFARKTVDQLEALQGDVRDQVTDWVDDMTEIVKDGVDRGKKLGAEGYEQVLQRFDSMKKCVEGAASSTSAKTHRPTEMGRSREHKSSHLQDRSSEELTTPRSACAEYRQRL